MRAFLTSDQHIGRTFSSYGEETAEVLVKSRLESLRRAVTIAEDDDCDVFLVAGDLFDSVWVTGQDVGEVVKILSSFDRPVLVLPGNHDFFTDKSALWKVFSKAAENAPQIHLLAKPEPYLFETDRGEQVVVYPAPCTKKHSAVNAIGWIGKATMPPDGTIRIGLAHGAIEGVTNDQEGCYFPMSRQELSSIPVDFWAIGHTHVPYPKDLPAERPVPSGRVFNAGTHEMLDPSNHTDGYGFEIEVDEEHVVRARKVLTGQMIYAERSLQIHAESGETYALERELEIALRDLSDRSVVLLTISGTVTGDEYARRQEVYTEVLQRFPGYRIEDGNLSPMLTKEMIEERYPSYSIAADLLKELFNDPAAAQMAEALLQESSKKEAS